MAKYFVISCTEDGVDFTIFNTKGELLKQLALNGNGEAADRELYFDEIRECLPGGGKSFWELGEDIVIIKGDYVVPREKQVAVAYEID